VRFQILLLSFFISITPSLTSCKQREENGILDDGIYEVKFNADYDGTPSIYENYDLTIDGSDYTKHLASGQIEKGKIEKIYNDKFVLSDNNNKVIPLDSLNEFQKGIRNWGLLCFEITEYHGDTIRFRTTFSGQLHVNINKGLIIKKS
jgi:hypothetical protein